MNETIRIFITGARGFIGKNLVNTLSKKYVLLTPSHSELDLLDSNSVREYFKNNRIDIVIHCAVVGGSRPEEQVSSAISQNLKIFFNLVNNKKYYRKLIHLGSGAEYDKSHSIINVKETDFGKNIPSDDYGIFKYTASKYIEKSPNIVCLRLFGIYGKHEDYRYRFISNAIIHKIQGLPITISQNVYFNYIYIDDFAKIIDYFITHEVTHKFYNLGSNNKIDLLSLAKILNACTGEESKIIIQKEGLNNEYTCDNTRLIKEIPDLSFTSYSVGIKKLYKWYKSNKHLISL